MTYPVDSKSREELKGQAETVQAAMAALGQAYLNHSQAKAMLAAASVELSRCEREVGEGRTRTWRRCTSGGSSLARQDW